jgi:C1A family cysteine protease
MAIQRSLGALKDAADNRDWKVSQVLSRSVAAPLPNSIDYTDRMPEVRDQGSLGACVGFASTEMKTAQEVVDILVKQLYSPLFIYWQRENTGEGMTLRDAMKILAEFGVCPENDLPYNKFMASHSTITDYQKARAKNYTIQAYARLESVEDMRRSLVEHGPFIIAVPVYDSFFITPDTGVVPMPNTATEKCQGGHALVVIGYDDSTQMFKFKNSWGKDFGKGGYGYLSYTFVNQYMWDAWNAVDAKSKKPSFFSLLWEKITNWFKTVNWMLLVFAALALAGLIYSIVNRTIP